MQDGAAFFRRLLQAPVPFIAVENPIPHKYAVKEIGRKYDQIVRPWQFGNPESKSICWWLRGLPALEPTNVIDEREHNVHRASPGPDRWKERSRFFPEVAEAMADQWGAFVAAQTVTGGV